MHGTHLNSSNVTAIVIHSDIIILHSKHDRPTTISSACPWNIRFHIECENKV